MPSDKTATEEIANLEKLRDERCFPIVKNILKEFPNGLIVDLEKQKELQLKCLSVMLSADLNVDQEVAYIPQLILGVLSGLNKTVQECGLENDERRYDLLACDVLAIVVGELGNITLGSVTPENTSNDFSGVKEKLIDLFKTEKLSQLEVKYVMEKIFDNFTSLNNAIQSSIADSTARMEAKILGIESMSDLTLKKLDNILTS